MPGALETRTGGYGYDREIIAGLRALGWTVQVANLDASYPFPTAEARAHAAATLAAQPDGALVVVDGLAFGAMDQEAAQEAARLRLVALVHHPLALENGLDPGIARALAVSEFRALAATRGVVVTSPATADVLVASYGVARSAVAAVMPGTSAAPIARGSATGGPVHLLAVASLVERKGYDVLMAALAALAHLPWRLTCVGSPLLQPATAAAIVADVRARGLETRVTFAGEMDQSALDIAYDAADVFVLPTRYEGYGLVVAEAIARGLPVVSTRTGGIPDLVGDEAGRLLEPGDVGGWIDTLAAVLAPDGTLRQALAAGARVRREQLRRWPDAAEDMSAALQRFSTS